MKLPNEPLFCTWPVCNSAIFTYIYLTMNPYIEKLHRIAGQNERLVIGLMSGTSLDGLDIALCRITDSGRNTSLHVTHFCTKRYTPGFCKQVREVFARRTIDQQVLCGLHARIGEIHGALVNEALREWNIPNERISLIASHGQTVFHAPKWLTNDPRFGNSTLQIGDGDHLATTTGIVTVSDFRQKHVAAGGEGAPLAAYGDYLLFVDETEARVLLNIGGIANFTFLPPADTGKPSFATDTGPGNTLMDQYMQATFGINMDQSAQVASSGTVDRGLLEALLQHPFFSLPNPKTTGPELFNLGYLARCRQMSATEKLSNADVMATLCAFSATTIARAIHKVIHKYRVPHVYLSGGGLHNPLLVEQLREYLAGISLSSFDTLGLLPDAKEAALFAVLANETIAGDAINATALMGSPAVCMGKISFPQ